MDSKSNSDCLVPVIPDQVVEPPKASYWRRNQKCIIGGCGVVILVLIAVGVALYFLLPNIAQAFMDGSQVSFSAIRILQPQAQSFQSTIVGRVSNAGPFSATTDPMNITIYYNDLELGQMTMPAMDLKTGTAEINVTLPFRIVNESAFSGFTNVLMNNASFVWRLKGLMDLKVMGMTISNLTFDKSVFIKGMNRFSTAKVQSFEMNSKAGSSDMNVQIQADVFNPSPISVMGVGSMTFDMFYNDQYVGRVLSSNVSLESGTNILNMTGSLVGDPNKNASYYSSLFSNYMTGKPSSIQVQCVGVGPNKTDSKGPGIASIAPVNSSVVPPAWLSKSLTSMKMSVLMNGLTSNDMIKNVSLDGVFLQFSAATPTAPILRASSVIVDFKMPFNFSITILEMQQNIDLLDQASNVIGKVVTPTIPASNAVNPLQIVASLPPTTVSISPEQVPLFSNFMTDIFLSVNSSFVMRVNASVTAKTPVGIVTLSGIEFTQKLPARGMQGLKAIAPNEQWNPVIKSVLVQKGSADSVQMEAAINLFSPASIGTNMGDVTLDLFSENIRVGYALLTNLTVNPGNNEFTCQCFLQPGTPEGMPKALALMGQFVNGKPSLIGMRGSAGNSTQIPLVAKPLSYLDLTTTMNGLPKPIVESSRMRLNPFTVGQSKTGKATFFMVNPFNDTFTLMAMKANISFKGELLATMDFDLAAGQVPDVPPVQVPALQSLRTPQLPVFLDKPFGKSSLAALGNSFIGQLDVDVSAVITSKLGNFSAILNYEQREMPSSVIPL